MLRAKECDRAEGLTRAGRQNARAAQSVWPGVCSFPPGKEHAMWFSRSPSLRRRLAIWIGAAFAISFAGLAAATVATERSLVAGLERAAAESLVAHLAAVPELEADTADARRHLDALAPTFAAGGASLEIAPPAAPSSSHVVASRRIDLGGRTYELRYGADAPWVSRLLWRAVALHLLYGAAALALVLAGVEWILRTRLVAPLARIAHQVRFMGNGGGWSPQLPRADAEIGDVGQAIVELGPALQAQVEQWIEGERRAVIARALAEVRARLREPHRHLLALAGDLQARDAVLPEAKPRLRALIAEIERLTSAIRELEVESFGSRSSLPARGAVT